MVVKSGTPSDLEEPTFWGGGAIDYITPYVLGPVDCKVGLFATVWF